MTHDQFEHGPMVEAWLKEPTWLPDTDLARVSSLVHHSPQRRPWLRRGGLSRSKLMLSATTVATSIAAAVLAAGVLLTGLAPQRPSVAPIPAAGAELATAAATGPTETTAAEQMTAASDDRSSFSLPDPLPEGVTGGTLETDAGPIRWALADSGQQAIPTAYHVVPGIEGIIAGDGYHGFHSTTDGLTWQPYALADIQDPERARPVSAAASRVLRHAGGRTYFISPFDGTAWRLDGDGTWQQLEGSTRDELVPGAWIRKHEWVSVPPTVVDDRILFEVDMEYQLPRQSLGIGTKGNTERMVPIKDNKYALCRMNTCTEDEYTRVLSFHPVDDGLAVFDKRSGDRLGLVRGATMDELYRGDRGKARGLFEIVGDTFVRVDDDELRARAREANEPASPPIEPPTGADARWDDPVWVAASGSDSWVHLDGEWVSLAPITSTASDTHIEAGGFGNVLLLTGWGADERRLAVLELPADIE